MDDLYIIQDTRNKEQLKMKTFTGYKKNDVFQQIIKTLDTKKVEACCFWISECLVSGYIIPLFEKLLIYGISLSLNNPKLPLYLRKKQRQFQNQWNLLKPMKQEAAIHIRNSLMVRHMLFDIATTLIATPKIKEYILQPKIKEEDLTFHRIQCMLTAPMNILPETMIHFTDPPELKIIMNEILTLFKQTQYGYERCIYWLQFLTKWESLHKKKKSMWSISPRDVDGISKKHTSHFGWVVWELVHYELSSRNKSEVNVQIDALFEIYKDGYTSGKRNTRIPILYTAIAYLILPSDFSKPIRRNIPLYIQCQCQLQKMYQMKKINETVDAIPEKESKKPTRKQIKQQSKQIDVEIIQDKMNILNQLDKQIRSSQ
jgi:hypothetical protein